MTTWRVLWPIPKLTAEISQYPGVMSMATLLAVNGFEQEVVPAEYTAIAKRLRDGRSTVLAYSLLTCFVESSLAVNRRVKAEFPCTVSVFGGPHPTFFPEMIEEDGVDAVCIGEGEYPLLEFTRHLAAGMPVTGIANWWVKQGGGIHRNPVRPLLENLDELPVPDHGAFRRAMSQVVNQAVVITGRGCPYHCTYCYNHAYRKLYAGKGRALRRRSVRHVMEELRQVKDAGYKYIRFMDDLFILSPEWVADFAAQYKEQIRLPFTCLARANHVTPEIMRTLKDAGCYRVLVGVEAGNDHVRNDILKRNMSKEQIVAAARHVRQAGLRLTTANIVGIPGGSFNADWETLELNLQCRPHYASVALLHAYPRTEMYDIAVQEGMLDEEHVNRTLRSGGFGLESPLKFKDARERRLIENLHKFFPLAVAMPWLMPLIRLLIRLPSNRLYDRVYLISANIGMSLQEVPPRVGLPILWRKTPLYRAFDRLRRRHSASA